MKKAVAAIVVIVLVVLVGGGILLAKHDSNNSKNSDTSMNTMDMSKTTTNSNSSSNSTSNSVTIDNFAFSPANITVKKGTTVTWTNKDSTTHTVTSTSGPKSFDSGDLANGKTFSFTFDTVGTYKYNCSIHPTMTGTVTVIE